MSQLQIFFPMSALAVWTLMVLLLIPIYRFRAAARKEVVADDFKLGESRNVPEWVALANRNYMNLLELPVLFYVACLTSFVTNAVEQSTLILAWTYVALRIAHSFVHLVYNNVMHRVLVFASSNIVLVIIWMRLLAHLLETASV